MFTNRQLTIFTLMAIINVVSNEFVGGIERIYFDKTGKQIAAPKESVNRREAENFYSLGDLVKAIDITVFINIGKCMIGCIVKAHLRKQCMKIVSCFWACITNRNEDPTLKKVVELTVSQRLMIAVGMVDDPRDQNRTELERHDVVKFAACGGKCLIVHLPQGINSLFKFITCIAAKCACGSTLYSLL